MTKTELFKKVEDAERRTISCFIRLNAKENLAIKKAAKIRNLSVSDYMRKTALGRKADVNFTTEVVLVLRETVEALRNYHKALTERGIVTPNKEWEPVIDEAVAAMLRITK